MSLNYLKRCWAEIDLNALDSNINAIRDLCPDKEMIGIVKANAYGHSDAICAGEMFRLGIRRFAVSNIHEAERIRSIIGDINCFLLVFGYIKEENFEQIKELNITVTFGSVEFARRLNEFAREKNIKIQGHIAFDTGMSRVGIRSREEADLILGLSNIEVTGMYTHFAVSDEPDEDNRKYTMAQYDRLMELSKGYGLPVHCQNSGAVCYHTQMRSDYIRPGIMPYGLSPNPKAESKAALKQIMTLKSVVDQIKIMPKGTDISYGRTYTADSRQTIAIVPVGYADGYSRRLSNRAVVAVNGVLCPIRGRICMDQMMVDVTNADAKIGDEVLLYSGEYRETSIDYIADLLDTINYEIVCNVSARVPKVAVRSGKVVEVINER
ncbi:MAG TPA: alanine racemase [Ruminococcaceae bacterium]|nr:alanine racemase [Oscillospiraceae bacterium]